MTNELLAQQWHQPGLEECGLCQWHRPDQRARLARLLHPIQGWLFAELPELDADLDR